jgi:hypothetical protein
MRCSVLLLLLLLLPSRWLACRSWRCGANACGCQPLEAIRWTRPDNNESRVNQIRVDFPEAVFAFRVLLFV